LPLGPSGMPPSAREKVGKNNRKLTLRHNIPRRIVVSC